MEPESWNVEPLWFDDNDLASMDDDMRADVYHKQMGERDLQYMTFRVLYDIRNALHRIADQMENNNNE